MFIPRDYQTEISKQGANILKKYKLLMLNLAVRVGKTHISLMTARLFGAKKVLFLTKLKAISSIQADYTHYINDFELQIINYESLHKIHDNDFDLLILDESHQLGTFPKPNNKFKAIKKRFSKIPQILLTGTPTTESFSQYFHQFFTSLYSPFGEYKNFYSWFKKFGTLKKIYTSYGEANDYSESNFEMIMQKIQHLIITFTQKQAGFQTNVEEEVLFVDMQPSTYNLIKKLQDEKVVEGRSEVILADTKVKELQKIHQLYSGTIKCESGNTKIIDYSKGNFIKKYFEGKKIGIFYKFIAEKELLKNIFKDDITDDLDIFNNSNKNIMLQIVSGREGISLKNADYLVFYNIDFSALSYFQAKDRQTTIDRKYNKIYWIFSKGGVEEKIYKTVQSKKNFTTKIYELGV